MDITLREVGAMEKTTVYEVVNGHGDRMALVSDEVLAGELADVIWVGRVRKAYVDDAAARRLLESLKG